MAKRELSSTLKNLKFMQRGAANKEEKTKKEEEEVIIPDGNFPSSITTKKCVVIMEGDPTPGAIRGRMSFQSFNPSIDKLNEEASNPRQSESDATCSEDQGGKLPHSQNALAEDEPMSLKEESWNRNKANGDLKRKQVEAITDEQFPNKSPNIIEGNQSSSSNNSKKSSHKPPKRGKLDWNVLRSPKSRNKKG
ncbi:hypothetical protein OSB04_001387 [Centaurea solstitialis]|uniref:M-phase phosphoprotein 6 n=1 Tax=Centaurea solstitialis TaxID=347529 RepID=A0AA38U1G5_9ASTR|nr:hypothetical protein OSB04_001387 [Centaurea solstitialis]